MPKETLVERLLEVVCSADPCGFDALKPDLKRARVTNAALADVYIPEVARRLGVAWDEDRLSFTVVTIGVARLQAILREIGANWIANETAPGEIATVLLILPATEQHTLGAFVIAGWLRRNGISVRLSIAPSLADLTELLAIRRFDGAMISVATEDKLELCASLIKTLKSESTNSLRVAVGGAVLAQGHYVARSIGADVVTNDLTEAVCALGLTLPRTESVG